MIAVGVLTVVTFSLAFGSPADAAPGPEASDGGVHAAVTAAALPTAFPGCSWPIETTPSKVNVAAPDPYATYWTTPFIASAGNSLTIKGTFPTSRFMSFTVYNDSFQDFTNTVDGSSEPSDLTAKIAPDQGSQDPWRTGRLGPAMNFTVRIIPGATAAQQTSENAIPMIDQNPRANAQKHTRGGLCDLQDVHSFGRQHHRQAADRHGHPRGHSTTLAPCTPSATKKLPVLTQLLLFLLKEKMSSGGTPASCTSDCAPDLQYFGPSAASAAGLFPNPVNGYIVMSFTPRRGYVVVTHGEAPSSPINAGSGALGDSIGAAPVSWVSPVFQVRYWSISNYLAESPYPVVEIG